MAIPTTRLLTGFRIGADIERVKGMMRAEVLVPSADLLHLIAMQKYLVQILDIGDE